MNIQKNKSIFVIIICLLVLIGAGYITYSKGYFNYWQKETGNVTNQDQKNPDEEIKFTDEEVKQYEQYLKDASPLILAGDNGNKESYLKAIELYEKAAAIGNNNVWIPFLNIGNIYKKMGEYDKAEEAYNKALEISKYGSETVYLQKIDLYQYYLKKSNEDVIKIYEEALSTLVENGNIVVRYSGFLRDIGENEKALEYYKILLDRFPENELYKEEIAKLEAKIQK
ncbi:tetratricopeptide repeat protein [Candidatus Falkowbacteria bacterium]|nr:MAG: tetratricopeptide repeat protein [Candidatus Falkowbacteria bacterium]